MLREEFDRLIQLFENAADGKPVNLEDLFTKSVAFFEHLKVQIETGDPEEKREALKMMAELHKKMTEESERISQRSGMSEEQLLAYADNPRNFTAAQWTALQQSKVKISQAGDDLAKTIHEKGKEALPLPMPKEKKLGPGKGRQGKKSKWMKS